MKKYYLYSEQLNKGTWYFNGEFDSYEEAFKQARFNSFNNTWKTWKIEEVIVINTNE